MLMTFLDSVNVDPNNLSDMVTTLVEAAKGGKWSLMISMILMVLVFLLTKLPFVKKLLPKQAKPWVAASAAVVLAIATTAATTGDWVSSIVNGLTTGAAATGLWELVGKKVLNRNNDD